MNSIQLANYAMARTEKVAALLSSELREKLAIAEAAIVISNMDDSTPAIVKVYRLEEAIAEIRNQLAALA